MVLGLPDLFFIFFIYFFLFVLFSCEGIGREVEYQVERVSF